jgi:hypothetical protein
VGEEGIDLGLIGIIADTHDKLHPRVVPHDEVIAGVRYFNPASAGPRRFDYPTSVGLFDGKRATHVALDDRSVAALKKRMNQMK